MRGVLQQEQGDVKSRDSPGHDPRAPWRIPGRRSTAATFDTFAADSPYTPIGELHPTSKDCPVL